MLSFKHKMFKHMMKKLNKFNPESVFWTSKP